MHAASLEDSKSKVGTFGRNRGMLCFLNVLRAVIYQTPLLLAYTVNLISQGKP